MKRFKGPKLEAPELKVPPFLKNLYNDLRDRRLLPVAALLIVAILATPFLLGSSKKSGSSLPPIAAIEGSEAREAAQLAVVPATPGLRDYRKRLRHLKPSDPFAQKFTKPVLKGAELQSESSTSGGSSTSTSTTRGEEGGGVVETGGAPPAGGGSNPGSQGGGKESPGSGPTKLYTYAIDIRIMHTETQPDGSVAMGEPEERKGVRPLTPLPGEKTPVVTFIGINPENGKALLMVSKAVTALFGEAECVAGTETCELLEIERDFPITLEYGPEHVRYKFNLLKVRVVAGGINR